MARPKNTTKTVTVAGSVSEALRDALEDHRWTARKTMGEVVREALTDYAAKHDLSVESPEDTVESADTPVPGNGDAPTPDDGKAPEAPARGSKRR